MKNFSRQLSIAACFIILQAAGIYASTLKTGEYTAQINGVKLFYKISGNVTSKKAPVLFLHGGPGYNSYSFEKLSGYRLEDKECMIYLDQRGCGRSERPKDNSYSVSILVDDIEALRRHIGVDELVLMGHSFGGLLALEYSARYPEHVSSLILPGGLSDTPGSVKIWFRQLRVWHPEVVAKHDSLRTAPFYRRTMTILQDINGQDFFNRMQFRDQRFRMRQDSVDSLSGLKNTGELTGALFSQGLSDYQFRQWERIKCPALIIAGSYDYAIGIETMHAMRRNLKNATFSEYTNSAHFPYLEESDKFEREVEDFLGR